MVSAGVRYTRFAAGLYRTRALLLLVFVGTDTIGPECSLIIRGTVSAYHMSHETFYRDLVGVILLSKCYEPLQMYYHHLVHDGWHTIHNITSFHGFLTAFYLQCNFPSLTLNFIPNEVSNGYRTVTLKLLVMFTTS